MKALALLVASILGCSAVPADPPSDADAGSPTPTADAAGAEAPIDARGQAGTLVDRYDFEHRTARFDLPGRLDEISGLATAPDGRLFAHDDERGRVHEILPAAGEVGARFDLGDDVVRDDFEGIAIAGERFFLISSRGWLYEFAESGDETSTGYRVTDTGVGGSCEVEGLDYDEAEQALLIACKVSTPDRGTIVVHRLPLDPARPRLAPMAISRAQLEGFGVDPDFQPSAVAVDPVGTIVLVSGRHEAIIEVDRTGRVLAGYALSPGRHPQPEGVEFGADGTLFISDERNGQPARVTTYALVRPGGAMIRRLSLPVPEEAVFAALTAKAHPLGMRATKPTFQLLRETYFDTVDGALAEGGMTLRVRAEARGHGVLELSIAEEVSLQGIVQETALETPIVGAGLYATLAASSEISTRIRELVDPHALRPRAAVDVDRETRELKSGPFGRVTHRIAFDDMVAHAPGVTRAFQEVTIVEVSRGATTLETLGARLRGDYDIVGDGMDTYERVRTALVAPTGAPRPGVPQDVRISLMMVRDWEVALVDGSGGLTLPTARGSGEELAREYTAELQGADGVGPAELDLVGFATARRGGSDLEVWLHERVGGPKPSNFVWIPLPELMERLGGPRLRDPGLVATLLMLVRSEIGHRLLREAPQRRRAPRVIPLEARDTDAKTGTEADDYLDLELSILDFNQRVLELAEDPTVPLLERFRFLSIFASNMDEFFVVRVGRLKDEVSRGSLEGDEDLSPEQLLDLTAVRVRALVARQYALLKHVLLPALAEQGVRIVGWEDLKEDQKTALSARFSEDVFPLLTPLSMASGPGRPFPRLVSLGLALAAVVRRGPDRRTELGYVPIAADVPRFVPVPDSSDFIAVEHLIAANAHELFPGAEVDDAFAFRASRLGDVEIDEDSSGSLLEAVADQVESRPYKPVIRLEVESRMPREVRAHIVKSVGAEQAADAATLTRSDVYEVDGLVDLRGVSGLCDCDIEGGLYPPFSAHEPLDSDRSIFDILAEGDVLCHHPFQAFEASVGRFLREAAADPDVVAIKLTLYRTGRRSPIMDALMQALRAGKEVAVFVELKARFDEESNIQWTHRLKEAGARVVYGVVGYKTHAKTALVIRRERDSVRRYVHIGTGNYNAATARFYTDLGLMSADPDLGADLNDFFNELTGAAGPPQKKFRRLLVAPNSLVQEIERLIKREVEHAKAGRPAHIQAKVNGLADRKIVKALYKASRKGVEIDLIVRSICTLRPGVEGLSDRIRVRSILGRFLEHSRILYFENAGQSEYYIGSADLRARNLRRRVEVVTPVDDPSARAVLRSVIDRQLADPRAWVLRPDGVFERLRGEGDTAQQHFMATGGAVE